MTPNQRIRINGVFLDEVRTPTESKYARGGELAFRTMPAEHHRAKIEGDYVSVQMPLMTLMQLLFDGVIPQDRSKSLRLSVDGNDHGERVVEEIRLLDGFAPFEPIVVRFRRLASSLAGATPSQETR